MTLRFFRQVFFKGLIAVLPLAATIYLMIWLVRGFESVLGPMLESTLPENAYIPGMGIGLGLTIIFVAGLALQAWLTRRIWALGERLLDRMPMVRQIYGAVKQVISYVGGTEHPQGKAVVTVRFGDLPTRLLGLVTRDDIELSPQHVKDDLIAVFLPWSYQIGGITVFVPRTSVERVDLTPQEALRFSLTAGVTTEGRTQD